MRIPSRGPRAALLAVAGLLTLTAAAQAADVKVMISGGFSEAYQALVPEFRRATGDTVETERGPSMGTTANAIPVRIARGEPVDVVIMVGYAVDDLIRTGAVVAGSRVDLARSPIGVAIRAGAQRPDISTVDALRRTLLAAKSVAYSDSASGVYVSTELFERLGIAAEMKGKARMIPADPVGGVVARGDAEIGLQQVSELLPIPGIEVVGPLPDAVQKITLFSAGLATHAKDPEAGQALIRFLASPGAAPAIVKTGLEPIPSGAPR